MELQKYGILNFNDDNFGTKLIDLIKEFGIVVIKNVIPKEECDIYTKSNFDNIIKISNNLINPNDLSTWKINNLPQQVKPGMFHEVLCNLPATNLIRFNPNIIKIFKTYYNYFKNKQYNDIDLVVSNDGINFKPGSIPPYDKGYNWAHLDQTQDLNLSYKCIQGQMILTNTTAGFVASPKSHLLFEKFVTDTIGNKNKKYISNFLKFDVKQYDKMKSELEKIGGTWQIPILASKGDFIIWTSSTVHCAKLQDNIELPTVDDKWNGFRHVIYICYRPRDEFSEIELKNKYNGFITNKVSNHWGTFTFASGFNRWTKKENYCDNITKYIKNPELVYEIDQIKPILTETQQIMMGHKIPA
jgi:hypothetical protein